MGILDEAIREHLELKRQHGAEQDELRQLESEAFGPADRPQSQTESPREGFDSSDEVSFFDDQAGEDATRVIEREPQGFDQAGQPTQEYGPGESPQEVAPEDSEQPPPPRRGREIDTAEHEQRVEIAEQPTEHFDVLAETADEVPPEVPNLEQPPPPPKHAEEEPRHKDAASEGRSETEGESSASPDHSPAPPDEPEGEQQFDTATFSEETLSAELDRALDVEPPERATNFFDEESDEYRVPSRPARPKSENEHASRHKGHSAEGEGQASEGEDSPQKDDQGTSESSGEQEDMLEETPEFLEETPEHDRLWFEQRPPKDFDFND